MKRKPDFGISRQKTRNPRGFMSGEIIQDDLECWGWFAARLTGRSRNAIEASPGMPPSDYPCTLQTYWTTRFAVAVSVLSLPKK